MAWGDPDVVNTLMIAVMLAALALIGWLFSEQLPFGSDVVTYFVQCPLEGVKRDTCAIAPRTAWVETYRASATQQVVLHWRAGIPPERMTDCTVRDARNWSCFFAYYEGRPSVRLDMVDGTFVERPKPLDPRVELLAGYQVPKWRWWWLRLRESLT
jgi:hypothetical protein